MANSFESALMEGLLDETETRSGLRGVSDVYLQQNLLRIKAYVYVWCYRHKSQ